MYLKVYIIYDRYPLCDRTTSTNYHLTRVRVSKSLYTGVILNWPTLCNDLWKWSGGRYCACTKTPTIDKTLDERKRCNRYDISMSKININLLNINYSNLKRPSKWKIRKWVSYPGKLSKCIFKSPSSSLFFAQLQKSGCQISLIELSFRG